MIDVYLLYGPPGVGKGTVAECIPAEHCLGVGKIVRDHHKGNDGQLMPDEWVNALIKNEIQNKKQYVVLDGYPRTVGQAKFLKSLPNVRIARVYALTCPDHVLVERLGLRQTCACGATYHPILKPPREKGKCDLCGKELFRRPDDNPQIIQKRLHRFHRETEPLLNEFGPLVRRVDLEHQFKKAVLSIVNEILSDQKRHSDIPFSQKSQKTY